MDQTVSGAKKLRVPALIKKNTALFALSQTFTGAGMQFAYGLGPLIVLSLTGSSSLAGLSVALIGLSRFLVAYPMGKITDNYGRKPGILLGLSLAMIGTLIVGTSININSAWIFVAGLLVFSMGMHGAQQLRVAATDMYPPQFRAQALGYVALGSLVGLLVSPTMIALAEHISGRVGYSALALPWLFLPILIVPGMLLVRFVRPDPKQIGMNLKQYYPDYNPPPRADAKSAPAFSPMDLLRLVPTRLAIVANCAAQANMSIVMVLTSLVLSHHGHSLSAIGFSHVFHSAGMFAFTIPLGWLSDRLGRERVMYPGVAVALSGAALVTFTPSFWLITLGTFLVGLGWAAANVSATAMIADHAPTVVRGRAIGTNDSFAGGASVVSALATGPLITVWGLPGAGVAAILFAVAPLALFAFERARGYGRTAEV